MTICEKLVLIKQINAYNEQKIKDFQENHKKVLTFVAKCDTIHTEVEVKEPS